MKLSNEPLEVPDYVMSYLSNTHFKPTLEDGVLTAALPDNEVRFFVEKNDAGHVLAYSDRNETPRPVMAGATRDQAIKMLLFNISTGRRTRHIIRLPSGFEAFPNVFAPGWAIVGEPQTWNQLAKRGEIYEARLKQHLPWFSYLADVDLEQVVDSLQDFNAAPLFTQFLWTRHAPTIEEGYFTPPDQWVWPPEGVQLLPHN